MGDYLRGYAAVSGGPTAERLGSSLMGSPAEIERKARHLPQWARAICWAFGVAFGGVGSYAVFATDNQAGTAALLILSALFSLIALTGRVPQRLQFGENAVEWPEEVVDAVATAIEEGSPEVAEKVVSAISESAPDRIISIATDRLTGATVERLAQATLMLVAMELEDETGDTFSVLRHPGDGMVDFHVVRESRKDRSHDEVPIIVKRVMVGRKLPVPAYVDRSVFSRVMLILYGELSARQMHLLTERYVYVVQVDSSLKFEEAVNKVKQCLRTVFHLNSDPPG